MTTTVNAVLSVAPWGSVTVIWMDAAPLPVQLNAPDDPVDPGTRRVVSDGFQSSTTATAYCGTSSSRFARRLR